MPRQSSLFPKADYLILSDKEMEALMFSLDDPDAAKLALRFPAMSIDMAIKRLGPLIEKRRLPRSLSPVEQALLQWSIEDSDWPDSYVQFAPTEAHLVECRATMRKLARRFEPLGIEVNRIAYG